jgi:hypothetical protein
LPSSGFGLPSFTCLCSCSVVSVVGLGVLSLLVLCYIRSFSTFCVCSLLSNFYDSFFCAFHRWCLLSVFLSLALFLCSQTLRLSGTSFVSFLFSFLFAFVVVLVHLISSLQPFCSSVRLLGLFVLPAKKIIFHCFALFRHCAIRTDRAHKI